MLSLRLPPSYPSPLPLRDCEKKMKKGGEIQFAIAIRETGGIISHDDEEPSSKKEGGSREGAELPDFGTFFCHPQWYTV